MYCCEKPGIFASDSGYSAEDWYKLKSIDVNLKYSPKWQGVQVKHLLTHQNED